MQRANHQIFCLVAGHLVRTALFSWNNSYPETSGSFELPWIYLYSRCHPAVCFSEPDKKVGLPHATYRIRESWSCFPISERPGQRSKMLSQLSWLPSRSVEKPRLVGKHLAGRVNQLLCPRFFESEQQRYGVLPGNITELGCISDPLYYARVSTSQSLMHGILKADPAVPVAGTIKPRQHLQLKLLVAASLLHNICSQPIQNPPQNWPDDGCQGQDLIRHGVQLSFLPNTHKPTPTNRFTTVRAIEPRQVGHNRRRARRSDRPTEFELRHHRARGLTIAGGHASFSSQ